MNDKVTIEEIEKWRGKLEPLVKNIVSDNSEMLINMKAYVSDSKHFQKNGDLVRSFEAIVWAWSIYEICTNLGIFRVNLQE